MSKTDDHAVAQLVHDPGAALWFGGSVAGVAGFNKAGNDLADPRDRIRVANSAWSRYGPVEWARLAAAGALATFYATYTGRKIGAYEQRARAQGTSFEVKDASQSTAQTPPELAARQRRQRVAQYLVPALSGGNLVLDSYPVQAYRPAATARGVLARLLAGH